MPLIVENITALQEQVSTALWRLKHHNDQWLEEAIISFEDRMGTEQLADFIKFIDWHDAEGLNFRLAYRIALMKLYFAKREKDLLDGRASESTVSAPGVHPT